MKTFEDFERFFGGLKQQRDELKLKLHLLKADVRDEWEKDVHESAILKKKSLGRERYLTDFEAQFEVANNPNVDSEIRSMSLNRLLPEIIACVRSQGLSAQRYIGEITSTSQAIAKGILYLSCRWELNDKKRVVGKVSHWDVLRALEPKYKSMGDGRAISQCGWSADFVKSMVENYGLLQNPLDDACHKAANLKVRNVMTPISEEELLHREKEIVEHDAPLNEVIHLLVLGNLMFLYVRKEGRIVGIIRLSDVFRMISDIIKGCS